MTAKPIRALSEVLEQIESAAHGERITVEEVIETLGRKSFASLMLISSLISTSPASAIPGITAAVAAINFILVTQMIAGRESLWLPRFLTRRSLGTAKLRQAIAWLRRPVGVVERYSKERLTILFRRPWLWLQLIPILLLTLTMPFMEIIPTSGSVASAVIAFFAAGILTRDGVFVILSLTLLLMVPFLLWNFGFAS